MATNNNSNHKYVIETHDLEIFYGSFKAVTGVNMKVERHKITAIIGPSGCGKSTLLRAFNRMNELYAGTSIQGQVMFDGEVETLRTPLEFSIRAKALSVIVQPSAAIQETAQ